MIPGNLKARYYVSWSPRWNLWGGNQGVYADACTECGYIVLTAADTDKLRLHREWDKYKS